MCLRSRWLVRLLLRTVGLVNWTFGLLPLRRRLWGRCAMTGDRRVGARAEQKRRWDREHTHVPCPACGAPMTRNSTVCKGCWTGPRAEARERRWARIESLWAAGLSMTRIAEDMGYSRGHLGGEMATMRAAGRNVPHRYRVTVR